MKDGYSILKYNVCHTAQEKLRQAMGIMEGGDKSKVILYMYELSVVENSPYKKIMKFMFMFKSS